MNSENKNLPIILGILISYIIVGVLFSVVAILFLGYIDWAILILTGFIHTIVLVKILKLSFLRSLTLGFLVSSVSLICTYLFYQITSSGQIALFLLFVLPILFFLFIHHRNWKFSSTKKLSILSCMTLLTLFIALNLKNFYLNEFRNIKPKTLQISDSNHQPLQGDSVKISILRNPLLNLQELHPIEKSVLDRDGKIRISLSESTKYYVDVYNKENYRIERFYMDASILKNQDLIILEISK
jgi:hypothetical protein